MAVAITITPIPIYTEHQNYGYIISQVNNETHISTNQGNLLFEMRHNLTMDKSNLRKKLASRAKKQSDIMTYVKVTIPD